MNAAAAALLLCFVHLPSKFELSKNFDERFEVMFGLRVSMGQRRTCSVYVVDSTREYTLHPSIPLFHPYSQLPKTPRTFSSSSHCLYPASSFEDYRSHSLIARIPSFQLFLLPFLFLERRFASPPPLSFLVDRDQPL